jgi:hypothetical protein
MRKKYTSVGKKKEFDIRFNINEVFMPPYDPLKDPFLNDYFENYNVRRHLEQIGIKKKRHIYLKFMEEVKPLTVRDNIKESNKMRSKRTIY